MNRREFCGGLFSFAILLVLNPSLVSAQQLPDYLECKIDYLHEVSSRDRFERYIYNLLSQDYHPVTLQDIGNYFLSGKQPWPEGKKPYAITFDDRLNSQYKNAVPVLDQWQIRASFACMAPGWKGDGGFHEYFSDEQLLEISNSWEIASHTINHANLPRLRINNFGSWQAEIIESKLRLEDLIGKAVTTMVYPEGAFDSQTLDLVSRYYKIGASTKTGTVVTRDNLFFIPRNPINI